jgi:hypothetical protein
MPKGYQKSPRFGGPEFNWQRLFWVFVALVALSAVMAYFR